TADELTRARNAFRADFIHERETTFGRAEALQHYNLFHGSVAEINSDLDRYLAVSAADVQRAAAKYLEPANSVVVIVRPKAAPAGFTTRPARKAWRSWSPSSSPRARRAAPPSSSRRRSKGWVAASRRPRARTFSRSRPTR